jgi:hypothetical protein
MIVGSVIAEIEKGKAALSGRAQLRRSGMMGEDAE